MRRRRKHKAAAASLRWTPDTREIVLEVSDVLGLSQNAATNHLIRLAGSIVLNRMADARALVDKTHELRHRRRAEKAADLARTAALAERQPDPLSAGFALVDGMTRKRPRRVKLSAALADAAGKSAT